MINPSDVKIAIIGAGNVATHFARILKSHGFQLLQIYSRTQTSAMALAYELDVEYTCDIHTVTSNADLYIVSLKDSVLHTVLPELVQRNTHALYIHTAGSVPMDIWKGLTTRYGVVYPMQTFSKSKPVVFDELPIFIESNNEEDSNWLQQLFSTLSSKVRYASSEQRKYLHVAAVFACNFTNHIYAVCNELLQAHGLPFDSMLPLIDETARKVHTLSPIDAQTGPAQRNDSNIMHAHIQMLEQHPEAQEIYRLLSSGIRRLSNPTDPNNKNNE